MHSRNLKTLCGRLALVTLALVLNALIWTQSFFAPIVVALWCMCGVSGLIWLVLALLGMAERHSAEQRTAGGLNAVFSSLVFLGICMVIYLFLSAWDTSWDLTREGRRDLSPQTIQTLQAMTREVEVICFFLQIEEELVAIAQDKTLRFLENCQRHTPLLRVEVLDPTVDRARLEAMQVTHASVQGTIVLRAGDRQRVITLSGGSPRLEERDFTNALINVLRKTEPKVYFMTGHHERDILDEDDQKGGSILGNLLRGESYQVERMAIKLSDPEIPLDADVVVINEPSVDFLPSEIEALDKYIDQGGRIMLLINPWRGPGAGHSGGEQLRPWIERRFGIAIGGDIVITDQRANKWQAELTVDASPFEDKEDDFMAYRGAFSLGHPITRAFDQSMLLQVARTVSVVPELPEGAVAVELLRTTPDFWAETDTDTLLQTGAAKWDSGERRGPLPLAAAAVTRIDKSLSPRGVSDSRAVVVGDADFASNGQIIIPGHLNFIMNAFAWLTESEDLIAIRPSGLEAPPLILSPLEQRAIAWVSIMLTVQVVIAVGLVVHIMRRGHQ